MSYGFSSRHHLVRAYKRLDEKTHEALFYAALEVRCGVEARLREYLDVWDHISTKKKKGWRTAVLGSNIEEAFRNGSKVVHWTLRDRKTRKIIVALYHTPVLKTLQHMAQKFGGYLHAQRVRRADHDPWWGEFRKELEEACSQLEFANTGTLLGPPLINTETNEADIRLEPLADYGPLTLPANLKLLINVSYHRTMPKRLKKEPWFGAVSANQALQRAATSIKCSAAGDRAECGHERWRARVLEGHRAVAELGS